MDPVQPINPGLTPAPSQPAIKSSGLISPNKIYQTQNGNFMDAARVVNIQNAPRHEWKLVVVDVLAIVGAALFGWTFARYLGAVGSFWSVLAALFFWGAMSVLEGFLAKDLSRRFLIIVLESIALVAWFYAYTWQSLAITAILVLFCLMWGFISIRRELRNTIEVRFFTASGKMLGKVITAAVVFMVIMYASLASNNGNFFVSQNGFDAFFSWAGQFVNNFYPTLPLNGSFNDFSQAVARMQLQGNPQFQSLSADQQNAALVQSANDIMGTLSNESSTAVASSTANEPASNAFYGYLASLVGQLQAKFGDTFVGVWGLILFLILRSIGIIAVWAAQFVSLIFYEILLATGFIRITEQSTNKENIEY